MLPIDNHHVRYEWWMLGECFMRLEKGVTDQFWFNVLHESYCVHAWNLWEYVKHLIEKDLHEYVTFEEYEKMVPIFGKIYDQIITLTERRTEVHEEKLGPGGEHQKIYEFIKKFMAP